MTTPGGFSPPNTAYRIGSEFGSDLTAASAKQIMRGGVTGSYENAQQQYHGVYNAVIDDHSRTLADLTNAIEQLILQGTALRFDDNDTYYPTTGIVSIDVIIIGAGAGAATGRWDVLAGNRRGGGGGGGGGETHTTINAALLPKNPDGSFQPIPIWIGAGGTGGVGGEGSGTGGGTTSFGDFLRAGGGQGALWGGGSNGGIGGLGGFGMIPGGNGGQAYRTDNDGNLTAQQTPGGNSVSPYDLYGGGGGGGAGGAGTSGSQATNGGAGGISPGGIIGMPGGNGASPSAVVATGGGGGGGGEGGGAPGGHGGWPGGGGGGGEGGGSAGGNGPGGNGAGGVLYVIERMS